MRPHCLPKSNTEIGVYVKSACEALGRLEPAELTGLFIEGGFTLLSVSDAAPVAEQLRGSR